MFHANRQNGSVNLLTLPPTLQERHLNDNAFSGLGDVAALPSSLRFLRLHGNHFGDALRMSALLPPVHLALSSNAFCGQWRVKVRKSHL